MKNSFIAVLSTLITANAFSQVIGGHGNSDPTPKVAQAANISAGGFAGDVNLFTGDYGATIPIGGVSTPGGLSFNLSYEYGSAFTVGGTPPISTGIPYGEGWNLNIPTISVETEVFNNFSASDYCTENESMGTPLDFRASGIKPTREGDLYWFSPFVNIPGVASGRAIFKHIDVADNNTVVFVLNAFESQVELRFNRSGWKVITADGTQYVFSTAMQSANAPANRRMLFYEADDPGPSPAASAVDTNYAGSDNQSVFNSITPKASYNLWYCDEIRSLNLKGQNILFVYEKFGAFNYFQEFQQEAYKTAAVELFQNTTFAADNDYTFYSDILLKRIESHAVNSMVQLLKLNYETNKAVINANPELMPFYNSNFDGGRLDSLYTYNVVYDAGLGDDDFTGGWHNYKHLRAFSGTMSESLNATNPYVTSANYVRLGADGEEEIIFDHGFVESPRITGGTYGMIPGDIYEVRTKINRDSSTVLHRGNATLDIAVVTGDNNNPTGDPDLGYTYSTYNGNNNTHYFSKTNYEHTRGISLYSTFNMALKWTLSYSEGVKHTSNFFVMPNIPSKFGGINVQIGPGNSELNYAAAPSDIVDAQHGNKPYAVHAYPSKYYGYELKSAANVPANFGIGLPWEMMVPVYKSMISVLNATTYSGGNPVVAFEHWWHGSDANKNRPTQLDETVELDEFELLRYTKNPYMLTTAELYQVNGEINSPTNDGLKLIAKKKLEYTTKRTQMIENYDYDANDPLVYKSGAYPVRQVHVLLKAIREIPVDGTTDTAKFLTTFLDYSTYTSADSVFSLSDPVNGHKGYLLTTFTDHLGGITKIEYYPPTDTRTYYTERFESNHYCNSTVYTQPFGMRKASTIHPVVKYILKNDEQDLVKNGTASSNNAHKRWHYDFKDSSRVYKITDLSNPDTEHFHHGRKSSYSTGFKKVTVYGPTLTDGSPFVNKTVYEHYGHQLATGGTPTDEDYLLHGKIKSIREYDVNGKIFTEKLFSYGYTLAFKNGYTRPNPYMEDIIWDQDFDNPGGHYEYRDYYLRDTLEFVSGGDTLTGSNAYSYLSIPVFNGTGESKEMPRFLDFEFYPELTTGNSAVQLHSYFVKKTEEISRTYDDYLSKQAVGSPIVLPEVVSPLPNPFGGGKVNGVTYNHTRDSAYMHEIATEDQAIILGKLLVNSPVSDTVLKTFVVSTRFDSNEKTQLLAVQQGLSNNVWKSVLTNQSEFTPTDLTSLIHTQPYFADEILTHGINNMSSRWDQGFLEAFLSHNTYLSHPVQQHLLASTNYITTSVMVNVLAKQPQMRGNVLSSIITSSRVPKNALGTVFRYQMMTDTLFNQLDTTSAVPNLTIVEIIENGLSYPNEATFLSLIDRNFSEAEMERICAVANRELEASIQTELSDMYPKANFVKSFSFSGNPLKQFCTGTVSTGWSYIENKTTYEYYEADYRGIAQGRAYKVLMGLEDIPSRTVNMTDLFGSGGTKTISTLNLKHEPSWQVFAVTSTSVHLPDAKQEQQLFYLYDLRNRYDRYWYNYDIKTINSEITSFDFEINGADTVGFTGRWDEYYTGQFAIGNYEIPKYDGMTKSRQYNLRSLPFQQTTITKSQRNETAMARSEYFFYDARWRFENLPILTREYDGPGCPEVPPTPSPSDCEQCMYWKYGSETDLLNALPNNYCLWEDDVIGFYACPYGIDASVCFPGAEIINCNPLLSEEQLPDQQRYMQLSDALGKSLQLRSTIVQLDTIMGTLDTDFKDKRFDRSNTYIADFTLVPEEDPNGFEGIYKMVYPFDTLTTLTVKERNHYFQPALTKNQAGIHTRYYYKTPQQYWNTDTSCTNPAYSFLFNYSSVEALDIGLPHTVTVGHGRNDSLQSIFTFTNDGQVKQVVNPSSHSFDYTFDGYNRLTSVKENGTRLLSRNAYSQWNHNGTLSFNERIDQNYVYSILYSQYVAGSDTSQRELQKAFIDPLGRTAGVLKAYKNDGDVKVYSGTPTYDNWGRVVQTRKPFVSLDNGMTYRMNVTGNPYYMTTRYDHDPGSLAIRMADIGMDVAGSHTIRTRTWIVNYVYASCELDLNNTELQLIMRGSNNSGFRFKRTSVTDQDDNETITYSNAFGQTVATIGWTNLTEKVVTLFVYDNYGNLTKTINAKRQHTDYKYNILGQMYLELTTDGGTKRYLYNKLGQISAIQDQIDRNHTNGGGIPTPRYRKFTYDDYGKPTGQYWVTTTYHEDAFLFESRSMGQIGNYYIDQQGNPHYLRYTFSNRSTMDWINDYTTLNAAGTTIIAASGLPTATSTVTEKTTTYGTNPTYPLQLGKVVETKSYNNNVAVQKITFTYDAQERLASQLIRQHPTNEATNDSKLVVAKIDYPSYNFRGSLLEERLNIGNDATTEIVYFYRYDEFNRLSLVSAGQHDTVTFMQATPLVTYNYNDATGQLSSAIYQIDTTNNQEFAQIINYSYDVRDRLTGIHSELMQYDLFYDAATPLGYSYTGNNYSTPVSTSATCYNGNIRGMQVGLVLDDVYNSGALSNLFDKKTTYGYTYDRLNRLTNADAVVGDYVYAQFTNGSNSTPTDAFFIGDEKLTYDKIGNIATLVRHKTAANMNLSFATDDFVYQYTNGTNRLSQADGQNGTTDRNYTYDANGNLLTDDFKSISNTVYRRGSYAHSFTKGSDQIDYLYDAGDLRFYKKVQPTAQTTEESTIKDAMGRDLAVVKWIDNTLQPVEYYVYGKDRVATVTSTANNKILNTEATFFLYDHLGNTRVAFKYSIANNTHPYTIVNAMDYYPYGKILREFDNGNGDRYLTTAHERDRETGLDYRGARYYDSDVARFLSTDPWAAKYPSWSTYNYVAGNPVMLIDPTGKGPEWIPVIRDNRLYVKMEAGDNAETLADFLDISLETATELFNNNDKGLVDPGEFHSVWVINKALKHAKKHPDDYGGYFDSNYDCHESSLALLNDEKIDYYNIIEGRELSEELYWSGDYEDVTGDKKSYTFSRTLVRFGNSAGNTEHSATYLGTSRNGTIYMWSKNGNSDKPGIYTVKELKSMYDAVIQGVGEEPGGGFYNLKGGF